MQLWIMTAGLGALGVALTVAALVIVLVRANFEKHARETEGTVTGVDDSSGEYPAVTFTAADASGEARAFTFRSRHSTFQHRLGQKLTVFYDPRDPRRATIAAASVARNLALALGVAGVSAVATAAMLGVFIVPTDSSFERATEGFLAAVRGGAPAGKRPHVAPDATLDETFLQLQVRPSARFDEQAKVIGFDHTGCVRGVLLPQGGVLVMSLVEVNGQWLVRRASASDQECDERLDD